MLRRTSVPCSQDVGNSVGGIVRNYRAFLILAIFLAGCAEPYDSKLSPTSISETSTASILLTQPFGTKGTLAPITPRISSVDIEDARERMVKTGVVGWGITDEAVVNAMGEVPRHEFVPPEYFNQAYENYALPIGYGQTISQPYIVALMTQELDISAGDRVLEIGTGSGYQAAVLAQLGIQVYTIEIIGPLFEAATERLARLGYSGVMIRHADGYYGWEEESPFDAIIVTAAPDHVPQPLLAQLKVGGVMVIPVGPIGGFQELWRVTRISEDSYQSASLGGVRFVPFTREDRSTE
jgi:protein-L-isoaspartate(D-aspartate) O-methyltransferase